MRNKIKIISSMGMANKLKPELIKIGKLKNTSVCPIASKFRRELKDSNLTVVYSTEHPIKHDNPKVGSSAFNPPIAGMMTSGVVRSILDNNIKNVKINQDRENEKNLCINLYVFRPFCF